MLLALLSVEERYSNAAGLRDYVAIPLAACVPAEQTACLWQTRRLRPVSLCHEAAVA